MRSSSLALLAAVACATENDLNRSLSQRIVAPRWDDETEASTASRHFVAAFPDLDGRVLLFRSDRDVTVFVHQPAGEFGWAAEYADYFDISAGLTEVRLDLTDWRWADQRSPVDPLERTQFGTALVIEAESPVEVLVLWDVGTPETMSWANYNDRAITRLLPVQELGTRYHVVVPGLTLEADPDLYYEVVAVENGTVVYAAPVADAIQLNAGELVRIALSPEDLAADQRWLVNADRPVAVFAGGTSHCWDAPGRAWEQLPPVSRWATEYTAMPVDARVTTEFVVVSDEGALVQLDCLDPTPLFEGEVLRVEIQQPTRITSTGPVLVMADVRVSDCGLSNDVPGMAAVTPQALYRSRVIVEPLDLLLNTEDVERGLEIATVAAVASSTNPVESNPHLEPTQTVPVGEGLVEYLLIGERATIEGERMRGVEYGVGPRVLEPEVDFTQLTWRSDVMYVTHLGYDCTECVQHLLDAPLCP